MNKIDLVKYVYSTQEASNVDVFLPENTEKYLRAIGIDTFFYVIDYNNNKTFGVLANLAELIVKKLIQIQEEEKKP